MEEVGVKLVSPRNTPSTFLVCSELENNGSIVLHCGKCGFIGDRDVVPSVNLFTKYSRCRGLGVLPNVPKSNENPREVLENKKRW